MKGKFSLAILFALLACCATHASSPQTAAVHTFVCKGSATQATGPCPDGGSPDSLIQGADGNFYGAAEASIESPPESEGGLCFRSRPVEPSLYCTPSLPVRIRLIQKATSQAC
jgi:hypothetical protein